MSVEAINDGQSLQEAKINGLDYTLCYTDFVTSINFVKFHHDTTTRKGTGGKKHFSCIDRFHDSRINYQNLPINNFKRDSVGMNSYAQFEWNPFINTEVIKRK